MKQPARDPAAEAAGFVLAGGRSSRMGADKALELLGGRPLVAYALAALREAGLGASIAAARAGARAALEAFAPVVEDARPEAGPLGGICAALASTPAARAVFLPVDLPFLPASLLVFLLQAARTTGLAVTLVSVNGFRQSFPAVLGREALPVLEGELEAGRGGCFAAIQAAAARLGQPVSIFPVEALVQSGHVFHPEQLPAMRWFLNVNAPADLERARLLTR